MSDSGTPLDGYSDPQRDSAKQWAGEQGLLFEDESLSAKTDVGYRGPVAAAVAGITYRQLDYWARTEIVSPSVRPATGSGTARLYGFRDILELKIVKSLLDTGISLQQIRSALDYLRKRGTTGLSQITLMCDGVTVYQCTSPDEVIDLVNSGQGVFGIAIGHVWQDIEGSLSQLPIDSAQDGVISEYADDELAARRRARTAGE